MRILLNKRIKCIHKVLTMIIINNACMLKFIEIGLFKFKLLRNYNSWNDHKYHKACIHCYKVSHKAVIVENSAKCISI